MNDSKKLYFLFLYLMSFFGLTILSFMSSSFILFAVYGLCFFTGSKPRYASNFKRIFYVMIVFAIANMVSCSVFRGQDFLLSLSKPYLFYVGIVVYFALRRHNLNIDKMEKSLMWLSITGALCYLLQTLNPNIQLFITPEIKAGLSAGSLLRLRMVGQCVISFGLFFSVNKYFCQHKVKYILMGMLCALCLFLMGFRSISAALALSLFFLCVKYYKLSFRLAIPVIVCLIVFGAFLQTSMGDKVYQSLFSRSDQSFASNDYIRLISLDHYLNYFFSSKIEWFLGSGIPYETPSATSDYGRNLNYLLSKGYVYHDWGVLGYSWIRGVVPIACIVWFSIKGFFLNVERQYYYLGVWLLFMVCASLLSAEMFRSGAFTLQLIVLAMLDKLKINQWDERYN